MKGTPVIKWYVDRRDYEQPSSVKSNVFQSGILASVVASLLFALMPAYLSLLPEVPPRLVIGQRILWSTLFMLLLSLVRGGLRDHLDFLTVLHNWPGLIAGALLVGMQWGLFVWAPLSGETLGLALGYFLLPLVLVAVGRLFYQEQISPIRWLAVLSAVVGVVWNLWYFASFSWVALAVALGYPLYFLLRRHQPVPIASAFLIENLLLCPIAWILCTSAGIVHPFDFPWRELLLFSGVGLLGSLGMLAMLYASRQLPFSLFGLLGYLEPPLILLVGLLILDERIVTGMGPTYAAIGLGVALLVLDGFLKLRHRHPVGRNLTL